MKNAVALKQKVLGALAAKIPKGISSVKRLGVVRGRGSSRIFASELVAILRRVRRSRNPRTPRSDGCASSGACG